MRRGGVGIGAINKKLLQQKQFAEQATQIAESQILALTSQMESFKLYLEQFSQKYKSNIQKNPQFRKQFQDMCANIGVDPLASSKGFWSDILGVGDFYYELIIQIYEICQAYQERCGGFLYLDFVYSKLIRLRSGAGGGGASASDISVDDCIRAIQKLHIFGNSFKLIKMSNDRLLIQSIANELNDDHLAILKLAELANGCLTLKQIEQNLTNWIQYRILSVLDFMIKDGIIWIDSPYSSSSTSPYDIAYYFPSFYRNSATNSDSISF